MTKNEIAPIVGILLIAIIVIIASSLLNKKHSAPQPSPSPRMSQPTESPVPPVITPCDSTKEKCA
jgi:hypothetical protein